MLPNPSRRDLFKKVFDDMFQCVISIRKNTKKSHTWNGGVAIIARKGRGNIREVERKGSDDIVWVEMKGMGRKIHIGCAYLVPVKSARYINNAAKRLELEVEIERFRHQGMVIVMVDRNNRIGEIGPP